MLPSLMSRLMMLEGRATLHGHRTTGALLPATEHLVSDLHFTLVSWLHCSLSIHSNMIKNHHDARWSDDFRDSDELVHVSMGETQVEFVNLGQAWICIN